jgi:hypothetical protein
MEGKNTQTQQQQYKKLYLIYEDDYLINYAESEEELREIQKEARYLTIKEVNVIEVVKNVFWQSKCCYVDVVREADSDKYLYLVPRDKTKYILISRVGLCGYLSEFDAFDILLNYIVKKIREKENSEKAVEEFLLDFIADLLFRMKRKDIKKVVKYKLEKKAIELKK